MPRFKPVDTSPRFLAVDLSRQLVPGTFEYALHRLLDHEIDLSEIEARYRNDCVGASAYEPRVLLKIVLLAYSRGIVSSRGMQGAVSETRRRVVGGAGGWRKEQLALAAIMVWSIRPYSRRASNLRPMERRNCGLTLGCRATQRNRARLNRNVSRL